MYKELAYAVTIEVVDTASVHQVTVGDEAVVVFQRPGLASALDRGSVAAGRDVGQTGVFLPQTPAGDPLTFSVVGDSIVDEQTGSVWTVAGEAIDGPAAGDRLTPIGHLNTFWFAWSAYYPDSAIVDG